MKAAATESTLVEQAPMQTFHDHPL